MKTPFLFLMALLYVSLSFAQAPTDFDKLKNNLKNQLVYPDQRISKALIKFPQESIVGDQVVLELGMKYPSNPSEISLLSKKLNPDGLFTDIDYDGKNRSGWEPRGHITRILQFSVAYENKNSSFYKNKELKQKIDLALAKWFNLNLQSLNWWYNEIGVPKSLGEIGIILEHELTSAQIQQIVTATKDVKIGRTGQNKVWLAGNVLMRSLLANDTSSVINARNIILSEIVVGQNEGIQADQSFHQHGAQQQFGNYGAAFVTGMGFWGKVFSGTPLRIEQDKLDIIANLILNGYGKILWNNNMDVNALGRQFFKQSQINKGLAIAFAINDFAMIDEKHRAAYESLLAENLAEHKTKSYQLGNYHFWNSDQTIHRSPNWMASVKMASKRVIGAESLNGDNLKGYYAGDGVTLLYTSGNEYDNIFPNLDWQKLPGVTAYSDKVKKALGAYGYTGGSDYVGNVNDGLTGLTTMQVDRDSLTAKKTWLFTKDYILCVGGDINSPVNKLVTTSVDQNIQNGEVHYQLGQGNWLNLNQQVNLTNNKLIKVLNGSNGYIVLNSNSVGLLAKKRVGKWKDIMSMYPDSLISTQNIFSLWIDHGNQPKYASYTYLMVPNTSLKKLENFELSNINIKLNTKKAQLINLEKEKTSYLVAYDAFDGPLTSKINFKTDRAGMFMFKIEGKFIKLYYSDPTQKLSAINVEVNKKKYKLNLADKDEAGSSSVIKIAL